MYFFIEIFLGLIFARVVLKILTSVKFSKILSGIVEMMLLLLCQMKFFGKYIYVPTCVYVHHTGR